MYLPTAYWASLNERVAQTSALTRDLEDMVPEAAARRQLRNLSKARRLVLEAEAILLDMKGQVAKEDVDRSLPSRTTSASI